MFSGIVLSVDPTLLVGARIGVVGERFHDLNPDGTFRFRVEAGGDNDLIAVRVGGEGARSNIRELNSNTRRADLQLRLGRRLNGALNLTVESVALFERKLELGGELPSE